MRIHKVWVTGAPGEVEEGQSIGSMVPTRRKAAILMEIVTVGSPLAKEGSWTDETVEELPQERDYDMVALWDRVKCCEVLCVARVYQNGKFSSCSSSSIGLRQR